MGDLETRRAGMVSMQPAPSPHCRPGLGAQSGHSQPSLEHLLRLGGHLDPHGAEPLPGQRAWSHQAPQLWLTSFKCCPTGSWAVLQPPEEPQSRPRRSSATVHSASSRPDLEAVERLHPGRGLEGSLPRRAGSDAWTPHGGFPVIGGQADRGWSFLNAWLGKKTRG